ncbi:MAG TPA: hypothetical protein PLU81_05715 [Deltaproteobacteria bacterium]|nr:hypothetical protein [Deltaproteobacteria bacterium]
MQAPISLKDMADRWPSAYVAREKLSEFTGGILNPRSVANLDAQGKGIPGRIRIGRKCVYPVNSVIEYLEGRTQTCKTRKGADHE